MKDLTENCPREDCEGLVRVEMEYEPGDKNYGADADGNRGIAVQAYWSATAHDCSLGHKLTADEEKDVCRNAEWEAVNQYDDYDGPDQYDTNEERDNDY